MIHDVIKVPPRFHIFVKYVLHKFYKYVVSPESSIEASCLDATHKASDWLSLFVVLKLSNGEAGYFKMVCRLIIISQLVPSRYIQLVITASKYVSLMCVTYDWRIVYMIRAPDITQVYHRLTVTYLCQ